MTEETESTEADAADLAAIDDMIDDINGVVKGKLRSYMITSFAYLLAANLLDDKDAEDVMVSFVSQVCEGYKALKDERTYD